MIKLTTLLFLFFQLGGLQAQIQKGQVSKDKTISSEIGTTEKHQYKITLAKNQFALLEVLQQGVDLVVTTYDPKGEKIADFDSPNGKYGPELITLTSVDGGEYTLEIGHLNENQPAGEYALSLQKLKPKAATLSEKVDELFIGWDSNETPGAAVAVVKDGSVIYKKGYGMASLEYDVPISPSTIFHIASVSKQFTVFSILILEKEGKLSLDDDIRKYLPEVPDFGKTITLRHLASHTSGLRDQWNLLALAGWRLDDVITKEHVLKLVRKQKNLNFAPGDEFVYCNTGFTLLAEVVARVSGKSFAEFTKANIFEPLEMSNTLFYDDHEKIVKNRAYSYYQDSTGYKKSVLNYANVGATSLFTTVEDLSRWALNFSTGKVGNEAIFKKMNTPAVLNNGKTFGGALGQFVGEYRGLSQIQHGGADAGYRSFLVRFPDQKFSVAVFSNDASFNSRKMAHNVVDIYLKDDLKAEPKKETENKKESIVVDVNTLNNYVGDYELQPGFIISVTQENGQLSAQATGQPVVSLIPLSKTEFDVKGIAAKITFVPGDAEKIKLIKLAQGGQIMDAPRVKSFDKTAVKLSDFTGRFYSEELSTEYHFKVVGEKLLVQHRRLSDLELSPVKEDVFSANAWFFGQVEFVRDANNVISGCKVSSGRVRDLWFQKKD
ncbi:serine hydrolase [Fulvivirga sp. M361]|uniref:serine hydrolase n=1 Tax=Fulvivirga sp. M361 TaxID=2594266 RepID=UPI00117BD9EB|nr:serine hydrolase [Fulvivirga sp. M361]TRX48001.1 serine hydrolase [Fulvivirga sp. M361]